MIRCEQTVIREISEEYLFDQIKDFLFDEEISDDGEIVSHLPKDAQRLIFAKVGALMIDYSMKSDF